jgi:DNA-binding MarR family transcriptional regulator
MTFMPRERPRGNDSDLAAEIATADATALLEASKVFAAAVAHSLAGVEDQVSVPGLRVLVMLRAVGTMNVSAVADALGVNASSASRTCDRLVVAGLLDRRDAADDRRQVALTLTTRGTRFVDDVMAERRRALVSVASTMRPADRQALVSGLAAFVAAAASMNDRASLDGSDGPLLRWVV